MAERRDQPSWLNTTRRRMLGHLCVGAGAALGGLGCSSAAAEVTGRGKVLLSRMDDAPSGLQRAIEFPLMEALLGRRARRFSMGSEIPDGVLAFKSQHEPMPLSELEQMLVLAAATGNTGWNFMHYRAKKYAPKLSNYALAAGGRTFPSAAGFHTVEFFYTDDSGVYFLPTRDSGSLVDKNAAGEYDLEGWLSAHRSRIRKLDDKRLHLPAEEPYLEPHNTWCVNVPGSTLVIPVADVAQHQIAALAYLVQNGKCITDDINGRAIPGIEKYSRIIDPAAAYPLSFLEQFTLSEAVAELSTSCYAGMLMLQALGLGGWMFDGIDMFSLLGASGNPEVPGLGFRYDTDPRWPLPNLTGREGVFVASCPPHYPDMRAAVDAVVERKYGAGGPFNPDTPGPWKDTAKVRGSAAGMNEEFKECVTLMAQYTHDTFGRFPATVPPVYVLTFLQAHHLDLDFYDANLKAGGYLHTHADHMKAWHPEVAARRRS
jgi:hypothetical protein